MPLHFQFPPTINLPVPAFTTTLRRCAAACTCAKNSRKPRRQSRASLWITRPDRAVARRRGRRDVSPRRRARDPSRPSVSTPSLPSTPRGPHRRAHPDPSRSMARRWRRWGADGDTAPSSSSGAVRTRSRASASRRSIVRTLCDRAVAFTAHDVVVVADGAHVTLNIARRTRRREVPARGRRGRFRFFANHRASIDGRRSIDRSIERSTDRSIDRPRAKPPRARARARPGSSGPGAASNQSSALPQCAA